VTALLAGAFRALGAAPTADEMERVVNVVLGAEDAESIAMIEASFESDKGFRALGDVAEEAGSNRFTALDFRTEAGRAMTNGRRSEQRGT
jgi:hypothetical protein